MAAGPTIGVIDRLAPRLLLPLSAAFTSIAWPRLSTCPPGRSRATGSSAPSPGSSSSSSASCCAAPSGYVELFAADEKNSVLAVGAADADRRDHCAGRFHARPGQPAGPETVLRVRQDLSFAGARAFMRWRWPVFSPAPSRASSAGRRRWRAIFPCSGAIRSMFSAPALCSACAGRSRATSFNGRLEIDVLVLLVGLTGWALSHGCRNGGEGMRMARANALASV